MVASGAEETVIPEEMAGEVIDVQRKSERERGEEEEIMPDEGRSEIMAEPITCERRIAVKEQKRKLEHVNHVMQDHDGRGTKREARI